LRYSFTLIHQVAVFIIVTISAEDRLRETLQIPESINI